MNILYAKRFLEKSLDLAGLPSTYASILKYEKSGILIKPSANVCLRNNSVWRLYSEQEIQDNVIRLLIYKYPNREKDSENIKKLITQYLENER